MNEYLGNIQIDVDIVELNSDAVYEHLRNSTVILKDILTDNEEQKLVTKRSCSKCSKILKPSASVDVYSKNTANPSSTLCRMCSTKLVRDKNQNGGKSARETSDGGHSCLKCGKLYKTASTLRAHFLFKHPEDEMIRHCHDCDKTYPSLLSLKKHIRYMHQYDHRCNVCYKTFLSEDLLIAHGNLCMKTKTPCGVCNKIFHSHLALKNHVKYKHPESDNHRCDYCRRVFTTNRKLSNHIVTIHPLGETTCGSCDRLFNSSNALQSHILYKHTSGRAKCQFCHKVFAKMVFLRKHIFKRHS